MNRILLAANFILILSITAIGYWAFRGFTEPRFPSEVDGQQVAVPNRQAPVELLDRKPYNKSEVFSTVSGNLFQEARVPFQVAEKNPPSSGPGEGANPVQQVAPKLTLKGVVITEGQKIALLEGTYPVAHPNQPVIDKPLTRKGYPLGSRIGDYKITQIDKSSITLGNAKGEVLNLKLKKFPTDQLIASKQEKSAFNVKTPKNKQANPKTSRQKAAPNSKRKK